MLNDFYFFVLLLLFSSQSEAFLNIEGFRQQEKLGFNGNFQMKSSGAQGNTDKSSLSTSSLQIYKTDYWEYLGVVSYDYGESTGRKDTNKGYVHLRVSQWLTEELGWENFIQVEFNEFRHLELRSLVGTGLRYKAFRSPSSSLFMGWSFFYEREQLKELSDETGIRGNIYIAYNYLLLENLDLIAIGYYQPLYERLKDYRIQGEIVLEGKLNSFLSLVLEYNIAHDSFPPPGIKYTDHSYLTGFQLKY